MKYGRVLLADSHLDLLPSVHSLLATVFDTVLMVSDQHSLLDVAASFAPDLVVVDLSLPASRSDNAILIRRLKKEHPDVSVVVLSVHDEVTVVTQIERLGADGFVLKRTAAADLIPAVRTVLEGGSYFPPAVQQRLVGDSKP